MATGDDDFKSTGFLQQTDFRTGAKMAKPFIDLPRDADPQVLQVKYRNANGEEQGPFSFDFDPAAALLQGQIDTLNMTRNAWLTFSGHMGADRPLLYFTHLISYRCAIEKIEYGLDVDTPDTEWPVPACDPIDPVAIPEDAEIYMDAPVGTEKAVLRLTFKDGTQSDIQTYKNLE